MVILDTDTVSLLEWIDNSPNSRLFARLSALPKAEVATTVITYEEQMRGWMAAIAKETNLLKQVQAYRRLLRQLEAYRALNVLPFDEQAATVFQRLKKSKLRVGTMDLKVAAICLVNDAILLSRNLKHFEQIPGLKVEDWAKD